MNSVHMIENIWDMIDLDHICTELNPVYCLQERKMTVNDGRYLENREYPGGRG